MSYCSGARAIASPPSSTGSRCWAATSIAYLNLDKVIRIIREEDEPKPVLVKTFKLTDVQAEAILNMRLRALRKLEEMEIRGEHKALTEEKKGLAALLKDEGKRWAAIAEEVKDIRKKFGAATPLGQRRTEVADAPALVAVPLDALVEKEPITVIGSEKGWIRAVKGHVEPSDDVKYKEGDRGRFWRHAQSTDKLQLFATNGRFYTIPCEKLPRGRGFGEPLRLFIDLGNEDDVVALLVHDPARKLLVAARDGRGFVVAEADVLANTRKGKQVMTVDAPEEMRLCVSVRGDMVVALGENRKMIVFPLDQVPEMARGKGVRLQKFKDGGIADLRVFAGADGLTWVDSSGRTFVRSMAELKDWIGDRAQAGRLPPNGFPRSNRFGTPPIV
jgi:topoisomerase-4 subunit A